ncbi:mannose-6-phosphate isomerase, class I [Vibrio astriarenae]
MFKLTNQFKNYTWGSKTAMSELFGVDNPNNEPQAEMWMGAHPDGSSKIEYKGSEILLSSYIEGDKESILSPRVAKKFGELPYLFKVLAADSALSIQVHPNKEEAESGFKKENALGIPRDASNRSFRDPNHKPELVWALTPYQALNGFRDFHDILQLLESVYTSGKAPEVMHLIDTFRQELTPVGLERLFVGLLSLSGEQRSNALEVLMEYALESSRDVFQLIVELSDTHPADIGLLAPLLLNVITLNPGEAMFLDSRTPHAYLKGSGLEVMANSDNVLRAGLTSKYIDIDELANSTSFVVKRRENLLLKPDVDGNRLIYNMPVSDFQFNCFIKAEGEKVSVNSAEIVLAIDSKVTLITEIGETLLLDRGESVFIPAYTRSYSITSSGRVARVFN